MNLPKDAAQDQTGCPHGYYRNSQGMLHQIPDEPAQPVITEADLSRLEQMGKEELLALIRLCNAKQIGYALLSKEEKRERLKLKVYTIAMESTNDAVTLKAANDWLDREDGKAMQQIRQETHITGAVAVMSADEVRGYISEWNAGKNQPIVIDADTTNSCE